MRNATHNGRHPSCHPGFSLVEILVALGVIGLLAAFLLPAISRAREAALRISCTNNLRQLGLALGSYVAQSGRLPSSVGNTSFRRNSILLERQFSAQVQMLLHLEQEALFNAVNFDVGAQDFTATSDKSLVRAHEANQTVATIIVSTFLCPSDGGSVAPGLGANNYRCNQGTRTGMAGLNGPFSDNLFSISIAGVTDGLSCTAAFGEKLRGSARTPGDPRRDMYFGPDEPLRTSLEKYEACSASLNQQSNAATSGGSTWLIGSLSQTCYNHVMIPNDVIPDCVATNTTPIQGLVGVRSNHPGGVQSAFCDGSVRFVTNNIDRRTWMALGTRAGGEPLPTTEY